MTLLAAALTFTAPDSAIVFVSTATEQECAPCRVQIPWSFMDNPNAKVRFRIDPCGCMHWYQRWTFVTRDGAIYTLTDSTGAMPRRLGSLWGPR